MVSCPNCNTTIDSGKIDGYGIIEVTVPLTFSEGLDSYTADAEVATDDLRGQLGNVTIRGFVCNVCEREWEDNWA